MTYNETSEGQRSWMTALRIFPSNSEVSDQYFSVEVTSSSQSSTQQQIQQPTEEEQSVILTPHQQNLESTKKIEIVSNAPIAIIPMSCSLTEPKTFSFPLVFPSSASQQEIYQRLGYPLVEEVINGYDVTVMSYGCSGSGKTYTLFGEVKSYDSPSSGMFPRLVSDIFKRLQEIERSIVQSENEGDLPINTRMTEAKGNSINRHAQEGSCNNSFSYRVTMSMYDILYEKIFDLLHPNGLQIYKDYEENNECYWKVKQDTKTSQAYVKNLTEVVSHHIMCASN